MKRIVITFIVMLVSISLFSATKNITILSDDNLLAYKTQWSSNWYKLNNNKQIITNEDVEGIYFLYDDHVREISLK